MKLYSSNAVPAPADPLRAQLRAEALAGGPQFSPELHQRTLAVLRANGLKGLGAEDAQARRLRWSGAWKIAAPLAVAAALAIAAWIVLEPPAPPPVQRQVAGVFDTLPMPSPSDVAQNLGFTDSLEEVKYGHIDEDAQRLASFVADQLPTFGLTDDSPQPPSPQ